MPLPFPFNESIIDTILSSQYFEISQQETIHINNNENIYYIIVQDNDKYNDNGYHIPGNILFQNEFEYTNPIQFYIPLDIYGPNAKVTIYGYNNSTLLNGIIDTYTNIPIIESSISSNDIVGGWKNEELFGGWTKQLGTSSDDLGISVTTD